jgi:hypothetical protein
MALNVGDWKGAAFAAFIGLGRVGGAPNDGGERVFPLRHFVAHTL